jgi:hypothetical protein
MPWTDSNGTRITTHPLWRCSGTYCVVHNPSDHHMRDWPTNIRGDRRFLVERICYHGVGHPDPDSLSHFIRMGDDSMGIHGCDGCCYTRGPNFEDSASKRFSTGGDYDPNHYFDRPD